MIPLQSNCLFCGSDLESFEILPGTSNEYICKKCGHYKATNSFRSSIQTSKRDGDSQVVMLGTDTFPLEFIQGAIYESNLHIKNSPHFFGTESTEGTTLQQLLRNISPPANPSEKVDKLLQNLDIASKSHVGASIKIDLTEGGKWCYARDNGELRLIVKEAEKRGYFTQFSDSTGGYTMTLSLDGWDRISKLKDRTKASRQGFVACWFSTPPNPNNVAIIEGIRAAEYEPKSLEGAHFGETIISKALGEIKKSKFVVVDLTEQRKSVFFEAGYALGRGLEVIFVIEKDYWQKNKKDLEFYVKNYNIKQYENAAQLKEIVESAIKERIG